MLTDYFKIISRVVQSPIKLTQDNISENFDLSFVTLRWRLSVYIVWPSVLSLNNFKPHKKNREVKIFLCTRNLRFIPRLTFNPYSEWLTGFRTTRPRMQNPFKCSQGQRRTDLICIFVDKNYILVSLEGMRAVKKRSVKKFILLLLLTSYKHNLSAKPFGYWGGSVAEWLKSVGRGFKSRSDR